MNHFPESPRIVFREFTTADAALIYHLNSDPEVVKYVHEAPVTNEEIALRVITERILPQYRIYGYGRWAMQLKETNEFIGWCGLKYRPERKETDLGYRLLRSHWGKGLATEASKAVLHHGFIVLHLPEITAMAHIENLASLAVLAKSGMQFHQFEQVEGCPVRTFRLANPQNH